uniref:Putative u3 small nucleolar rna-associated protein 14 log a n=1 Tax=Culex tarsalis TaxID=7177 RepID=A0A1Q3EXJ4_CULTA
MSDDEGINEPAHRKLLAGINSLVRTQDVSKATRTEPSTVRSEFNLFKRDVAAGDDGEERAGNGKQKVQVGDLLGLLKKTNKTVDLGKDLNNVKKTKRLSKPLAKPVADRIERDTLYGKTQKKLDLWEPVITASDVAPQTVFPLQYGKLGVEDKAPQKLSQYRVKSDLMVAMEELEAKYRQGADSDDDEGVEQDQYALTLEELREKRKEAARQRIRESYKIAKGRRMNKIKSKKFHKLLKRDKIREQIKQFEELQKTDPEAALKQLELIERQRFQERATLRHKNTGSWAKNMQIRAKYDMNVRQELAEQLSIGKELMAKRLVREGDDDSSESGEDEVLVEEKSGNPWMGRPRPGEHEAEANREFTSGYRKYWEERNQTREAKEKMREAEENGKDEEGEQSSGGEDESGDSEEERELAVFKNKVKQSKAMATTGWVEEDQEDDEQPAGRRKRKQPTVEDLFNDAEQLLQQRVSQKLSKIREQLEARPATKSEKQRPPQNKSKTSSGLEFKKKATLADADVELDESATAERGGKVKMAKVTPLSQLDRLDAAAPTASAAKEESINTKAFVQVKPKHLLNAIPDLTTGGDLSDEDDPELAQRLTIAEAFADDDIVADFEHDKQTERERNAPQAVDTFLPGWGAWGGAGIKNQKTRRKMFKKIPVLPRKDDNREKVIINEDAVVSKKLAAHLVNELPFPFTSVRDYEASLRAPLGRTFVPETAHATLVEPAVVTKMGAVIEPMKKDILLQPDPAKSFRVGGKQFNKAVRKYEEFLETKESL